MEKPINNETFLGGGCRTCPVKNCQTLTYRGSTCASQRAKFGLDDDPQTKAEKVASKIKLMTDKELKQYLCNVLFELEREGV